MITSVEPGSAQPALDLGGPAFAAAFVEGGSRARRVLIITADHWPLLEDGTTQVPGGESDRWRPGSSATSIQELAISGGRVVTSDGTNAVVCLWGESSRYAGRKNGYHGGLSPQELTVPMKVFSLRWAPVWQSGILRRQASQNGGSYCSQFDKSTVAATPQARPIRKKRSRPKRSQVFFAPVDLPPPAVDVVAQDWIAGLLASPIYASQRQLAARVALPDDKMRLLLEALAERGGKLSRTARRIGCRWPKCAWEVF